MNKTVNSKHDKISYIPCTHCYNDLNLVYLDMIKLCLQNKLVKKSIVIKNNNNSGIYYALLTVTPMNGI